jgi:hypothetical protein
VHFIIGKGGWGGGGGGGGGCCIASGKERGEERRDGNMEIWKYGNMEIWINRMEVGGGDGLG